MGLKIISDNPIKLISYKTNLLSNRKINMEISEQSFMNSETILYRDASNQNTREKLMLKYKLKAKA